MLRRRPPEYKTTRGKYSAELVDFIVDVLGTGREPVEVVHDKRTSEGPRRKPAKHALLIGLDSAQFAQKYAVV